MKRSLLSTAALAICLAASSQTTFNYTGNAQTYVVPANVTSVLVDVKGASGGTSVNPSQGNGIGGSGGRVQATIPVTPGETLTIYVGGVGQGGVPGGGVGGYNGGADGEDAYAPGSWMGGGGGGASDIRQGGTTLNDRVIVAGGGGGGGSNCGTPNGNAGGQGGGAIGGDALSCTGNGHGLGGTQSAGGAGGLYQWDCGSGGPAASGTLGVGGIADICSAGGGGGGGYYGGGGGDFGGGGGGSNFASLNATGVTHTQGNNNGDGVVVITPLLTGISNLLATDLQFTGSPNPVKNTLTLTVTGADESTTFTLFDITGNKLNVIPASNGHQTLEMGSMNAGVYFLELKTGNGQKITRRFVKE